MRVQRKQYKEAEVIIYSIIDIAFLLLIFFILTTTLQKTAGSKLTIPSGVADASRQAEQQPLVIVKPGQIYYGDKGDRVTLEELRARLKSESLLGREPNQRIVVLDSTPDVPYEEYFRIIMAIARAGGVVALVERSEDQGAEK